MKVSVGCILAQLFINLRVVVVALLGLVCKNVDFELLAGSYFNAVHRLSCFFCMTVFLKFDYGVSLVHAGDKVFREVDGDDVAKGTEELFNLVLIEHAQSTG